MCPAHVAGLNCKLMYAWHINKTVILSFIVCIFIMCFVFFLSLRMKIECLSWYWLSATTGQNRKSKPLFPAYLKWLIAVPKARMTLPWYLCYNCLFSHNMFSWSSQLPASNPLHMCRHEESVCFLLSHVAGESSQPESRLNLSWSTYPLYRRASGKLKDGLRFSLLWGSHQSFTHRYFMGQLRKPIFFCLALFSCFCVPVCVLFSGGKVCLVWWSGGALSLGLRLSLCKTYNSPRTHNSPGKSLFRESHADHFINSAVKSSIYNCCRYRSVSQNKSKVVSIPSGGLITKSHMRSALTWSK